MKLALAAAGGLAAITAAGIAWWQTRAPAGPAPPPPPPPDRPDAPELPPYVMNMAAGDIDVHAATAGDPMGPPVIADPGAKLEIAVRGEREVPIRVWVKLYWRKGEQIKRWQPSGQLTPFSTYRYRGAAEAPFGVGRGDIVAIVSPVDDIPDEVHPAWLARPPRHWQVMRQPVVWRPHGRR